MDKISTKSYYLQKKKSSAIPFIALIIFQVSKCPRAKGHVEQWGTARLQEEVESIQQQHSLYNLYITSFVMAQR